MSRRKDRERFSLQKRFDPNYEGFKGYNKPIPTSGPELKPLVCTRCGHRKNVSPDTPEKDFVCLACQGGEEPESPAPKSP